MKATGSECHLYQYIRYIICILLVFETAYALYYRNVWITGHFDNPAGISMFIVACFPFLYCIKTIQDNRFVRHFIELIFLAIIACIGSRAGIIALIIVIFFSYKRKSKWKINKIIKIVAIISVLLSLILLYLIKKDSADGRMLIWKCSCDMIVQKPLLGYGMNGFRKYYMGFQEQYFATHPDSHFADLADNITHPFNEYLHITVNYGLCGLIIFLSVIFFIIRKSKKDTVGTHCDSVLSLIGISVFSLFSYPFSYTACWILTLYNIAAITDLPNKFHTNLNGYQKAVVILIIISAGIMYGKTLYENKEATKAWHQLDIHSFNSDFDIQKSFEICKSLQDESYWYELSAELYFRKKYHECLMSIDHAQKLSNNSDLQILKGICLHEMGEFSEAKECYIFAHNMCPKLLKPLYLLTKLYEDNGDTLNAQRLAIQVLNKKLKIESYETEIMKEDLKKYIND